MTDDNQKFLDKFKNQISKMGKDGILGTDNDISSISNVNNNNNNKHTNIIIKNSLTDKNNFKKGSAFLKPINKSKINSHNSNININNEEQSKNSPNDNENKILENNNINKYNAINNPYITNNNSNLLKPNEIMNFQGMPYYPYPSQNPYFYYNNNNINNMNNPPQQIIFPPPYQLYYYSNPYIQNNNQNQNIHNVNINDNIKTEDKIKSKKKLRPISAQMIGRSKSFMNNTNTTINTNYTNNNNITTFTNSKYEYKPYTLKDYKEIINVDTLGGLGANIGTEEWEKKKEKMDKMSEYAKNIFKKTKNKNKDNHCINKLDNLIAKNKQKKDALSTRKRANEYSKLIRPKSSGQCKIIRHKEQNSNNNIKIINEKNNKLENNQDIIHNINNMNFIQGKYALLHHKQLNNENNINNNNKITNINNNNETNNNKIKCKKELKDIFGEISEEEDEEEKKLQEYYNKFKIDTDLIINDKDYDKIKKEKDNEINEDSLEVINDENNNKEEDNIINEKLKDKEIEGINSKLNNNNLVKKYKTFKEQRNAVNNKNNGINKNEIKINKDNNICDENNNDEYDNNDKELDLQSLLVKREKYLKEIEEIKKGL